MTKIKTKNPNIYIIDDNNKYGLYNIEKDKVIIKPKYKDINSTNNPNIFKIRDYNNKYGFYDIEKEKVILKPIYKYIFVTNNPNIFRIYNSHKYGFYDIEKE